MRTPQRSRARGLLATAVITGAGLLVVAPGATSAPAPAPKSFFVGIWEGMYPNSVSLDNVEMGTGKACQLCHVDPNGGDNYNAYGWAIKVQMDAGKDAATAMGLVESMDSDGDAAGASNLAEIVVGTQPGWVPGPNNTHYDGSGPTATNQMPPAGILGELDPSLAGDVTNISATTGGSQSLSLAAARPSRPSPTCSSAA